MVLRFCILLITIVCTLGAKASQLVYTDLFMSNYYQNDENTLYIGGEYFQLMAPDQLDTLFIFIDDFLSNENINDFRYSDEPSIALEITIPNLDFKTAQSLSNAWHVEYENEWNRLIHQAFSMSLESIDPTLLSAKNLSMYQIALSELGDIYARQNLFFHTALAFSLTDASLETALKVPNLALKRTSEYFYAFENTSISSCENLADNEVEYNILGANRNTNIKDCIAMHTYTILYPQASIYYSTKQSVVQMKTTATSDSNIIYYQLPLANDFSNEEFEIAKNNAITDIKNKVNKKENLFFFSAFDLLRLEQNSTALSLEEFKTITNNYVTRSKHNVCIPTTDNINNAITITPCGEWVLSQTIAYKKNDYKYKEGAQENILKSLINYLNVNPESSLKINGYASKDEYFKIENKALQDIITKYENTHYPVGKVQLNLARSLYIFQYLTEKGINPERIICTGTTTEDAEKRISQFR